MDSFDIFKNLTRGATIIRKAKDGNSKKEGNLGCNEKTISTASLDVHENIKEENVESKDEGEIDLQVPISKLKLIEKEEINHFRNIHRIHVTGNNIPAPFRNFDELVPKLNVPLKIVNNLKANGYKEPTPIQMQSIPIMLNDRSLLACAPTGSGKTIAFLLPIIKELKKPKRKGFRALIICPTRELAKQIQRECLQLTFNIGLRAHILNNIKNAEEKYGTNSSKKFDILIATPKRLCLLLKRDSPIIDLNNIKWIVIDEADKMMEEGDNSFKDQFQEIFNACTNPLKRVALFSATFTVAVSRWASHNVKKLAKVIIGERNSATNLVRQSLLFVGSESGKLLAIRDLIKKGVQPPVLIFLQSKDRAKQLFTELIYDGINVDIIHADRSQLQRDNVVKAFREGKIWILICTDLMGRGIDFKGINLVINFDFPQDTISYIHRIGRAGRAGRTGEAITFFTQKDTTNLRRVAHIIKNSGGDVPEYMLTLKKVKKSERKELLKKAPEREDISTDPKFLQKKRAKLNKLKNLKNRNECKLMEESDLIKKHVKMKEKVNKSS